MKSSTNKKLWLKSQPKPRNGCWTGKKQRKKLTWAFDQVNAQMLQAHSSKPNGPSPTPGFPSFSPKSMRFSFSQTHFNLCCVIIIIILVWKILLLICKLIWYYLFDLWKIQKYFLFCKLSFVSIFPNLSNCK